MKLMDLVFAVPIVPNQGLGPSDGTNGRRWNVTTGTGCEPKPAHLSALAYRTHRPRPRINRHGLWQYGKWNTDFETFPRIAGTERFPRSHFP